MTQTEMIVCAVESHMVDFIVYCLKKHFMARSENTKLNTMVFGVDDIK